MVGACPAKGDVGVGDAAGAAVGVLKLRVERTAGKETSCVIVCILLNGHECMCGNKDILSRTTTAQIHSTKT